MADAGMDIAVYGLIRSGTTLVSDLLTVRDHALIVSEPDLFVPWDERAVRRIYNTARAFGLALPDTPPAREHYGTFASYFEQVLLPELRKLDIWGIKQVQFILWRQLFQVMPPKKLILCLRDLREVALSSFDLVSRMGLIFGAKQVMRDEAWVMTRLCHDVYELAAMSTLPHFRARYEDLVTDTAVKQQLAEYAGVHSLGSERLNLEGEPDARSAWEQAKHSEGISNRSLGRFLDEPPGPARAIAERIWAILPRYSEQHGYALPADGLRVDNHSLAATPQAGPNPVSQTLIGWSAERPAEFEPAFARRHARVRAAGQIAPGSVVLDLGCVVPALRLMLPQGCRYVGSDLVRRFDECLVADYHAGELPGCDAATLITVLGLLEHIDEPAAFLKSLRTRQLPVLLTYHASEDTPGIGGRAFGWKNRLSRQELGTMIDNAGFAYTADWAFDGFQSLLQLQPKNR